MTEQTVEQAMVAVGFEPPSVIEWDGKLRRFATDRDKPHSKDGWYIAHNDAAGQVVGFGSHRDKSKHIWNNGNGRKLSKEELADIESQRKKSLADEKHRRTQAAHRAQRIYEQAQPDVSYSAYLQRKGIACPDGVRAVQGVAAGAFGFSGDRTVSGLVVPMRNADGEMRSLQIIPETGIKLFMAGGQTAACFHTLGSTNGAKLILIAEGLATAQSAREATGAPAVVAFSAGNLCSVASSIRQRHALSEIIILADDDDAGRSYAEKAAGLCGGRVILPTHGCNDFNDLHVAQGLDAVREAMSESIEKSEDTAWRGDLIVKHKDDGTEIIPCRVHNIMVILLNAPEFKGRVRYNEFSAQISVDEEDMDDVGPVKIKTMLERDWFKEKVPTGDVLEALAVVAQESSYHPVRAYLESLSWDGVERIPDFFSDHFGCEKDEYHMAVALSLFVSAVARIFHPGSKVDTMVILESMQGMGKTKLWLTLFGEFCAEVTSSLNDKDFFSGLRGIWCADFGELDQFSRAETTRIKQVITQTSDHYRPHYGRGHKRYPRQCIFVGGTNHDTWQTDATGARRFLPVKVQHDIDIETIAGMRDQLWAEAVVRYNRGEKWWHIPDAEEHQEGSYVGDSWEEVIGSWLVDQKSTTVATILSNCLQIEIGRQTRSDQIRAGFVLRRLGWKVTRPRKNGTRIRVYRKEE